MIDNCVEYLKPKEEITKEVKVASVWVIKELHKSCKNFKIADIVQTIDEFIEYHEKEYEPYIEGFALISDQFHTDLRFYSKFVDLKINSLQQQS